MHGLRRESEAALYLGLQVRNPPRACYVVCCEVFLSATGRFLVQRSPTKFVHDIECVEV
jgi:hypothetical protein